MKTGEQLKNEGMKASSENADSTVDNWKAKALGILLNIPSGKSFMVEDLREIAYSKGLPKPPSERAWGSVITKAKKEGAVEHIGYSSVKNPKAHKTPASVWMKIN